MQLKVIMPLCIIGPPPRSYGRRICKWLHKFRRRVAMKRGLANKPLTSSTPKISENNEQCFYNSPPRTLIGIIISLVGFTLPVVVLLLYINSRYEAPFDLSTLDVSEQKCTAIVERNAAKIALLIQNASLGTLNMSLSPIKSLELCPEIPPHLLGADIAGTAVREEVTMEEVIRENSEVETGGSWRPAECSSRHHLAVIIPYRDRLQHLTTLLAHLLPVLRRQLVSFQVIVVEQHGKEEFNKGRIMNAAFLEAYKRYCFQCIVFHDVDLIMEDDRNVYTCPTYPRHMSVAVDELNYTLPYYVLVGGVLMLRTDHFQKVNGYSNLYWGWGGEDNDMGYRILRVGLRINRPPRFLAKYKMIPHKKRNTVFWRRKSQLLKSAESRYKSDGLNSVQYKLMNIHQEKLFTHMLVDVGRP